MKRRLSTCETDGVKSGKLIQYFVLVEMCTNDVASFSVAIKSKLATSNRGRRIP